MLHGSMSPSIALIAVVAFLAYSNGSNDNFKGVATLYACRSASYRVAIGIATAATFAGSISALVIAAGLIKTFTGSGVVLASVAMAPAFLFAVAGGAAGAVIVATFAGLPISTTHALTGAIIGSGLIAVGFNLNFRVLGSAFFAPLLVSPVLAVCLTMPLYRLLHSLSVRFGIRRETCICLEAGAPMRVAAADPRANDLRDGARGRYRQSDLRGTGAGLRPEIRWQPVRSQGAERRRLDPLLQCGRGKLCARHERYPEDRCTAAGSAGARYPYRRARSWCRHSDRRSAQRPQGGADDEPTHFADE